MKHYCTMWALLYTQERKVNDIENIDRYRTYFLSDVHIVVLQSYANKFDAIPSFSNVNVAVCVNS